MKLEEIQKLLTEIEVEIKQGEEDRKKLTSDIAYWNHVNQMRKLEAKQHLLKKELNLIKIKSLCHPKQESTY